MEWIHQVSTEWLDARKDVITATELVGLRTGFSKLNSKQKAGEEVGQAFAALWGKKHSIAPTDPMSYGAAARGHWAEPFAVDDFNTNEVGAKMYHWDDVIIVNDGIGFSPDALNMEQKDDSPRLEVKQGKIAGYKTKPTEILEIKSYGIENHMKSLAKTAAQQDERWQLAVAMMVLPCLKTAYLLHYNPEADFSMIVHKYSREDLEKEIKELQGLVEMWHATCRWFNNNTIQYRARHTEQDIEEACNAWLEENSKGGVLVL